MEQPGSANISWTCPSCGRAVDPGAAHAPAAEDDRPPIPWHLWLLLAALTVYLGYRAFEGLEWLFGF